MKKSLRFLIPLIVVVFGVLFWRWTHPSLSDEEQINQALGGIAAQISKKSAGGVTSFLSNDFQLDGLKRKDIQKQLTLGLLSYAAIDATITSSKIEVNGDTATSKGRYNLGLKQEFNSPAQNYSSEFTLKWKRENGQWKISNADGNKLPPGLGGGLG